MRIYGKDLTTGKIFAINPATGERKEYASVVDCWNALEAEKKRRMD